MSRTLQFPYSSSALERAASPTTLSAEASYSTSRASTDDLSRNVYGLLGLSVDAIDFATVLQSLEAATGRASPFLISTKDPSIDPRFSGLFLMVRKHLASQGEHLSFTGVSHETRRMFRLNRFEFLLHTSVIPGKDKSGLPSGSASTAFRAKK